VPADDLRAALQLAYAKHGAGAYDDAERLGRVILTHVPDNPQALHLVGEVALRRGQTDEALDLVGKALKAQPRFAEAHNTLGLAHKKSGALELAAKHYKTAIRLRPDFVDAYNNLGDLLIAQGEMQPAMITLRRALAVDRRHVGALNNLGAVLLHLERYEEAAETLSQAALLDPDAPQVQSNLGNALRALGRADSAVIAHRRAAEMMPNVGEYQINLANSLRELGDLDGTIDALQRAIALEPNSIPAHNNLGGALLLAGRFGEGWSEFEWRWRMGENPSLRARYPWPLWNGEEMAGRSLLVWGEQGIGDVILFASMLPDLTTKGMRLTLEVDPRLVPLFQRSFPAISVVARSEAVPAGSFDAQVNIGRLGLFLRPDRAAFAGQKPFLTPDPARVASFKARYAALHPGPKIGIAWRSNSPSYRRKSIGLEAWAPLLARPDLCFVSLQYGDVADDLRQAKDRLGADIVHDTSLDTWNDLDGLAAQIASLDAVVSVSNLNVHLAGAVGTPTHVLLTSNALWYWTHNSPHSPWYRDISIHRQAAFASAPKMMAHIAGKLGAGGEKQR
jgi:tetratricopeptide (TPR) repeat protein